MNKRLLPGTARRRLNGDHWVVAGDKVQGQKPTLFQLLIVADATDLSGRIQRRQLKQVAMVDPEYLLDILADSLRKPDCQNCRWREDKVFDRIYGLARHADPLRELGLR